MHNRNYAHQASQEHYQCHIRPIVIHIAACYRTGVDFFLTGTLSNINLAGSPRPLLFRVDLDTGYPLMNIIWHDAWCLTFTEGSNRKVSWSFVCCCKVSDFSLVCRLCRHFCLKTCLEVVWTGLDRLQLDFQAGVVHKALRLWLTELYIFISWSQLILFRSAHCFIKLINMSGQFISTYRPAMFTCATRPTMYPHISLMSVMVNQLSFKPVSGVR